MEKETQSYICPQTKIQCDDECCVSAEECHIEQSIGVIFDCGPNRETLEEAAECKSHHSEEDFIRGAKWQAERMYSEEDMIEFNEWVSLNFPNQHNYLRTLQKHSQGLYVPIEKLVGYYSTKELLEKFKKEIVWKRYQQQKNS